MTSSGRGRVRFANCATAAAAVTLLAWASAARPDAHNTDVPAPGNSEPSCARSGCHIGTPLNGAAGSLAITAALGSTYVPGQAQTLTITVTDPIARVYGFQVTARLASDLNQQAGTFTPSAAQQVLCAGPPISDAGVLRNASTCPPNRLLEFIEQSQPQPTNTIAVTWTPPSAASGAVAIYVSAGAANGDGTAAGDHIYNSSLTLQPAASAPKPVVAAGGVINAGGFGGAAGVAPGTWLEIYGANLSTVTGEWSGSDFQNATAPGSLGGVGVTIAGKSAYIRYVSPGQVNVQAPDGIGTGPVSLVVTNQNGSSDPVYVTATDRLPGLLAPFGNGYVAAFHGGAIAGSPGFAAVKPRDVVTLYGVGFGDVSPAVPAGQIASGMNLLVAPLKIMIGSVQATTSYQGLTPDFVGLYQFNVTIPNLPDGDHAVTIDLAGQGTGQNLKVAVRQ